MATNTGWNRNQLLVAFNLYCQMPFGKMHYRNPEIIKYAKVIGRTPSALAMKLSNIASLDPAITTTGRKGLIGASATDKAMWEEMQADWDSFANEVQQAKDAFGIDESRAESEDYFESGDFVNYTGSNKVVQTTTRIGQSFFRRSVLCTSSNLI